MSTVNLKKLYINNLIKQWKPFQERPHALHDPTAELATEIYLKYTSEYD